MGWESVEVCCNLTHSNYVDWLFQDILRLSPASGHYDYEAARAIFPLWSIEYLWDELGHAFQRMVDHLYNLAKVRQARLTIRSDIAAECPKHRVARWTRRQLASTIMILLLFLQEHGIIIDKQANIWWYHRWRCISWVSMFNLKLCQTKCLHLSNISPKTSLHNSFIDPLHSFHLYSFHIEFMGLPLILHAGFYFLDD